MPRFDDPTPLGINWYRDQVPKQTRSDELNGVINV